MLTLILVCACACCAVAGYLVGRREGRDEYRLTWRKARVMATTLYTITGRVLESARGAPNAVYLGAVDADRKAGELLQVLEDHGL